MTTPKVLNRYHYKNTCEPKSAVYIGRPGKWGNPFIIGAAADGLREEVIEKYRKWLLSKPELVEQAKKELVGKDLICWCAPLPCHGDVLLEIANGDQNEPAT